MVLDEGEPSPTTHYCWNGAFQGGCSEFSSLLVQLISNSAFQIPICVLMMTCSPRHIAVVACPDYGSFIHHTLGVHGCVSLKVVGNLLKSKTPIFFVVFVSDLHLN